MNFERLCLDAPSCERAGEEFARLLRPGDIVLLSGPLGAGKTTFTKGVARGLGVSERVTSPTFTMVRQHRAHNDLGIERLEHCDVYRVESLGEVLDLALGELVEEAAVAVVEWGELAASLFGREVLNLVIEVNDDESRRLILSGEMIAGRVDRCRWWVREGSSA